MGILVDSGNGSCCNGYIYDLWFIMVINVYILGNQINYNRVILVYGGCLSSGWDLSWLIIVANKRRQTLLKSACLRQYSVGSIVKDWFIYDRKLRFCLMFHPKIVKEQARACCFYLVIYFYIWHEGRARIIRISKRVMVLQHRRFSHRMADLVSPRYDNVTENLGYGTHPKIDRI